MSGSQERVDGTLRLLFNPACGYITPWQRRRLILRDESDFQRIRRKSTNMEASMFWLKLLKDFIAIFREGQTPRQVAGGFMLGSIIGFAPFLTLQSAVVWLIILTLNVNLGAVTLAGTLCALASILLDPFFHWLGFQILVNTFFMQPFWTSLYNAPLAPLTRFNNTVVMGSFFTALVLAVPVYFGFKHLVIAYRKSLGARVEKLKIFQILKQSKLVRIYTQIRDLGGR